MALSLPVGEGRLDLASRTLEGPRGAARLSPIGCRFLELLAEAPGETVQRRRIVERLWSGNALVGEPGLNRLVSEVRRAGAEAMTQPLVETVHGRGYRLAAVSAPAVDAVADSNPGGRGEMSWKRFAMWVIGLLLGVAALSWLLLLANGVIWGLAEQSS